MTPPDEFAALIRIGEMPALGGVVDAIANKAAAFHEMKFLLSGLTPAVLDF
jgi:hypothetical protein